MEEKMRTNTVSLLSAKRTDGLRKALTQFLKPKSPDLFALEVYIFENLKRGL